MRPLSIALFGTLIATTVAVLLVRRNFVARRISTKLARAAAEAEAAAETDFSWKSRLELLNPSKMVENSTVMFSGPLIMTKQFFDSHFLPFVEMAIQQNCRIRVGCGNGTDMLVQEACISRNYLRNVCVYVPEKQTQEAKIVQSNQFTIVTVPGGFKSRDVEMLKNIDYLVARSSQYGGGASGTMANIYSFVFRVDGYNLVDAAQRGLCDWHSDIAESVSTMESQQWLTNATRKN